ncbi:MAG: DNA topology modulation protein, partial [Pyrinomonadaceae bacterium]
NMRKVLVIGSGGAGKSTLARQLGETLDIEVLHLDRFYWRAGWGEPPKDVWQSQVRDLIERDAWIMDGNYSGTLGLRVEACDTIIFLDAPRLLCLRRVLNRWAMYRSESRPDMAADCRERFSPAFLWWVWNYPKRTKPKVLELLKKHAGTKRLICLRSQGDVRKFLAQVEDSLRTHAPAGATKAAAN